jgi:hypothetical protein
VVKYQNLKAAPRRAVVYDTFLSVDFSRASSNVAAYYSPNSLNMIRDEYGKIRRRMGYFKKFSLGGEIYGMTRWGGSYVVHSQDGLYLMSLSDGVWESVQLYSDMNTAKSQYFRFGDQLYIVDGKTLLVYDGVTCSSVEGKVPRIIIGGTPAGGGTPFEQVNLICDKWEQSFCGTATDTVYQLAFGDLDATTVLVKKARLSSGVVVWDDLVEGTDFTVDRTLGKITFNTAPGLPVYGQEDNLIVTAAKDRSDQRSRIFGCSVAKGFGINGDENQLFLTGNPDCPNQLFWSGIGDVTYWGDLQYGVLGQDDSAIVSFNTLNTQLIAHKDTNGASSYLCSVASVSINGLEVPQITVDKVIGGSGCIAKYASAQFGEPLFLSSLGVQAVTYKDLTGVEMETMRGDRINRRLLLEEGIEDAVACVYKQYYLLCVNSHVYVLDRLNPQGEGNVLGNAYQYNAFYWDHIPACCFLCDGDRLLFGTPDGDVMEFYTDENATASYNDDGQTYQWSWEFPEYVGGLFYTNKAISYLALRAKAYKRTSVTVDVQLSGLWYEVLSDQISFGYLDLSDLDFANLNLSTDTTPKKTSTKYGLRRLDKFAFRVRGDAIYEPFGLYSFAFEVKEKGKHKK